MAVDVVSVEVRDDASGRRVDEVADAVVRHADGRGHTVVVIFDARQITRVIVGVVGYDTARPRAASEFAVWGIRVRRALAIGVKFVRHAARGFVVEPTGGVAVGKRFIPVGGHRDLVAVSVVGVVNWVSCATLEDDMSFGIVSGRDRVVKRISYRNLATERVVRVGCLVAERVDGLGNATLRVIDKVRRVAAPVGLRDLATEGVVGVGGGYAGMGAGGDGQATAGDGLGRERRVRG